MEVYSHYFFINFSVFEWQELEMWAYSSIEDKDVDASIFFNAFFNKLLAVLFDCYIAINWHCLRSIFLANLTNFFKLLCASCSKHQSTFPIRILNRQFPANPATCPSDYNHWILFLSKQNVRTEYPWKLENKEALLPIACFPLSNLKI